MTVKEAIRRLSIMADGGTNFSKESNEACRMGAEALKEIEKRGAVNCGQLCEWNTTAGCGKPNGVPCKMSNVTVAKNETVAEDCISRAALLEKAFDDDTGSYIRAEDVKSAPSVKPTVPRGEWIGVRNGKGICSNCNRLDGIDPLATHCRYCGADMRKRKSDNE